MEERRRFARYDSEFEIEYSPKADGVIYSRSVSRNISKGGVCIPVLSRLVRNGDVIKFDIYPKDVKRRTVTATGKVVWTKETSAVAGHLLLDAEAGIEFTDINNNELDKLLKEASE